MEDSLKIVAFGFSTALVLSAFLLFTPSCVAGSVAPFKGCATPVNAGECVDSVKILAIKPSAGYNYSYECDEGAVISIKQLEEEDGYRMIQATCTCEDAGAETLKDEYETKAGKIPDGTEPGRQDLEEGG
tara:strand:+ start:145 stop:534 length:390 start_codon:yes stop_codon:yes gene_type:complete